MKANKQFMEQMVSVCVFVKVSLTSSAQGIAEVLEQLEPKQGTKPQQKSKLVEREYVRRQGWVLSPVFEYFCSC